MKFIVKFVKITAFVCLILLAGIGVPLAGALPETGKRRQKSGDDGEKTETMEKQKKNGGDYRLG